MPVVQGCVILTIISLFQSGDEWIVSKDLYGVTYRLLEEGFQKWGLTSKYMNTSNVENIEKEINEKTKAIFLETPTNPMMEKTDIAEVARLLKNIMSFLLLIIRFIHQYYSSQFY